MIFISSFAYISNCLDFTLNYIVSVLALNLVDGIIFSKIFGLLMLAVWGGGGGGGLSEKLWNESQGFFAGSRFTVCDRSLKAIKRSKEYFCLTGILAAWSGLFVSQKVAVFRADFWDNLYIGCFFESHDCIFH